MTTLSNRFQTHYKLMGRHFLHIVGYFKRKTQIFLITNPDFAQGT